MLMISRSSDSSIEAPPSILPPQKYCDITGLEVSISLEEMSAGVMLISLRYRAHTRIPQVGCDITTKVSMK